MRSQTVERYSSEKLYSIFNEIDLDKKIGTISNKVNFGLDEILYLHARPQINPHFVSKIDEDIWEGKWKKRASSLGIKYYINKDHNFEKWSSNFTSEIKGVDYSKASEFIESGIELLKAHYEATLRYNNEVTKPLIAERTSLIDSILLGK